MTTDSTHHCHMYPVPLRGESYFIHGTQIQTQTNNGYFPKIRNGGTCEFAIFRRICIFFNINMKFIIFFNIYVEAKQIQTI
jgi:hypothetical protein